MIKWIKINKVSPLGSPTGCTCDSSCNSDACDECDASCYGEACICESTCYQEICTGCYGVCYVYNATCTCNGVCYSDSKYGCTCDNCYQQATCTCQTTCYSETCTACNITCYSENCTCDSSCNNDGCDECDSACYGYAVNCGIIESINSVSFSDSILHVNDISAVCGPTEIPTGLIIGFNALSGAAVPSGWAAYTTANGYWIIGAGGTYAVNANGVGTGTGSVWQSAIATTNTTGDHTGAGLGVMSGVATNGGRERNTGAGGNHSHTFTITYTPPTQYGRLIKAGAGLTEIPINGVVWTATGSKSSVATNVWTGDRLFNANATTSTAGNDTYSSQVSNSAGGHVHGVNDSGDGSGVAVSQSSGAHTHTVDIYITNAIQQVALAAWAHASSAILLSGYGKNIIGMYESTTPPDGWYLCNGSNGTPDLRDYFVKCTTAKLAGVSSGATTNNLEIEALVSLTHGLHNHYDAGESGAGVGVSYHPQNWQMSTHSKLNSLVTYMPSYYALAFIMYGG